MWSVDCVIDHSNITYEISRNATLYSKYLDMYVAYRRAKRKAMVEFERIDKFQTEYLKGRIAVDGKYYPYKLMSDEVKIHKKANVEFQSIITKIEGLDIGIDVLSRILDQIKSRSFDIRAIAESKKLEAGY